MQMRTTETPMRRRSAPGSPHGLFLDDGLDVTMVADGTAYTITLTPIEAMELGRALIATAVATAALDEPAAGTA